MDAYIIQTEQRELLVQFMTHNNESMPWEFDSERSQMRVMTGNQYEAMFVFHNKTSKPMVGQVIPSVSPGRGAEYFHKTSREKRSQKTWKRNGFISF